MSPSVNKGFLSLPLPLFLVSFFLRFFFFSFFFSFHSLFSATKCGTQKNVSHRRLYEAFVVGDALSHGLGDVRAHEKCAAELKDGSENHRLLQSERSRTNRGGKCVCHIVGTCMGRKQHQGCSEARGRGCKQQCRMICNSAKPKLLVSSGSLLQVH